MQSDNDCKPPLCHQNAQYLRNRGRAIGSARVAPHSASAYAALTTTVATVVDGPTHATVANVRILDSRSLGDARRCDHRLVSTRARETASPADIFEPAGCGREDCYLRGVPASA